MVLDATDGYVIVDRSRHSELFFLLFVDDDDFVPPIWLGLELGCLGSKRLRVRILNFNSLTPTLRYLPIRFFGGAIYRREDFLGLVSSMALDNFISLIVRDVRAQLPLVLLQGLLWYLCWGLQIGQIRLRLCIVRLRL